MPVSPAGLHTAATDHLDSPDAPWAVEPMDALAETELRKQRGALKDQIWSYLQK